jgi:lysophospholipase L1-like esterase
MPTDGAWLATIPGAEAIPAESFKSDPLKAAWLPNKIVARAWMDYVKDTAVKDATPPPAATNVRVMDNTVTWEAEADLESGLAHFLIERDGQFLAQVPREGKNPFGRPIFQNLQYSDTPTQPLMEMRYIDEHQESGKMHSYRVVAVNTVGLKSKATGELPKVILIGDSIRLSYAATVIKQLNGKAVVISPKANGGDSSNILRNLDQWVIREKPSVVHFNCGIHDTKKFIATGKFQVSPEEYEANLRKIVEEIRAKTDAVVFFATTTPILDDRATKARQGREYVLSEASIKEYNGIAKRVMRELKVPTNDLFQSASDPEAPLTTETLIGSDGVHLTPTGQDRLGKKVAEFINQELMQHAR